MSPACETLRVDGWGGPRNPVTNARHRKKIAIDQKTAQPWALPVMA
jgi:hypothetical protein